MASNAPITGAPTRAPAFPDLYPLDRATSILESVNGSLNILASYLEDQPGVGSDATNAIYAAGFAVTYAQAKLGAYAEALLHYRDAVGIR